MYYLIYGNKTHEARAKLKSLTETLHAKRPGAELFRLHDENWSEDQFKELLVAQGLFDQKYIVVLDGLLENKESLELIVDSAADMKASENVFLIIERDVDKKTLDKLSKYADKVQEFASAEKAERFNTFALADAFGKRDRRTLWTGYLRALEQGISPEELCGVLFWQAKNIVIVKKTTDAKGSKLSPFVDSKA